MGGFNWVDLIIILLVANAFYNGLRIGFLTLALMFGGLFAALFAGGWAFPRVLTFLSPAWRSAISINLILVFAALVAIRLLEFGRRLHISLGKGKLHLVESAAGVSLSVSSALIIIWLLAAAVGYLPFTGISNSANDSLIVQALDRHLPSVPAVFSGLSSSINPNETPQIYVKQLKNSSQGSAPVPPAPQAVTDAGASVVRVTGFGCGGIVNGSGFVIAPGLVATNAHVVAGVRHPIIKYRLQSLEGTPVFFDAGQDFSVLKVDKLRAKPLTVSSGSLSPGTAVYSIGYPKSIYTVSAGSIKQNAHIISKNIYGLGSFDRDIYEIDVNINNGSSGGPIVSDRGSVAGIVFGKASNGNYAVALASPGILDEIHQSETSNSRVGTGACLSG